MLTWAHVAPPLMLAASNVFMTLAWYGHLKVHGKALWLVVLASWGIAFFEYWLAVPANRIGYAVYSAAQLKTIQEVMSLSCFVIFAAVVLKEPPTLSTALGFLMILGGAVLIFRG